MLAGAEVPPDPDEALDVDAGAEDPAVAAGAPEPLSEPDAASLVSCFSCTAVLAPDATLLSVR